jgi:hypothetical protein
MYSIPLLCLRWQRTDNNINATYLCVSCFIGDEDTRACCNLAIVEHISILKRTYEPKHGRYNLARTEPPTYLLKGCSGGAYYPIRK